jgi:hypothetical protein
MKWGLGIGDGDWGLGPIPNPQSPFLNYFKLMHKIDYRSINGMNI